MGTESQPEGGASIEASLEHAQASYANAQETIRFIDTKTAILTGLATLAVSVPIAVLLWLNGAELAEGISRSTVGDSCRCVLIAVSIPPVASIIASALAVVFSTLSLMARGCPSNSESPTSILFPTANVATGGRLAGRLQELRGGVDVRFRLDEYCNQIEVVAGILATKILWHRRSVKAFLWQVILTFLSCLIAFLILCEASSKTKNETGNIAIPAQSAPK